VKETGDFKFLHLNYPQTDVFLLCFSVVSPQYFDDLKSYWFVRTLNSVFFRSIVRNIFWSIAGEGGVVGGR
jgi:hypothetical protein